jgi:citrate synthase
MQTITDILHQFLKVELDNISLELTINDVHQWDSLGHLELMMFLEERYSIEINEDTILQCSSVRGLCERLNLPL